MDKPRIVKSLAIAAVVLPVVAVSCWLARKPSFQPSDLRDTAGIKVEVTETRIVQQGYRVTCNVSNQTGKTALSIVLCVQVCDLSGKPLAENPLANLADLPPGQQRTILVPFLYTASLHSSTSLARAQASASLVRWE